jgi:putative FmdB family regulatory protein
MPTYEYACKACHHEWSVEQRITAPPITKCPSCGKEMAQRQISGGNFILKGGGWYSDLYSSSSNKPAEKKSEKAEKTPDAKADAKSSETKSESKTPTTPPKTD